MSPGDFASTVSDWLLVASVRVALLFALVLLIARVLRAAGVGAHVALWRAALVATVLLCALPVSLPGAGAWPPAVTFDSAGNAATSSPGGRLALPPAPAVASIQDGGAARRTAPAEESTADSSLASALTWREAAVYAWACGLALHLAHLAVGVLGLMARVRGGVAVRSEAWATDLDRARRSLGVAKDVRLLATPWRGAPGLAGWRRPVVLLPATCDAWSAARRRAVLAHELSHLAHRDPWFTLAAALLRAVFWFHPAVRFAVGQLSRYQELRCDDEAVRTGLDTVEYAESLLGVARSASRAGTLALSLPFTQASTLEERIRAVLSSSSARAPRRVAAPIALVLVSTAASALFVRVSPAAVDPAGPWELRQAEPGGFAVLELPAELERLSLELSCDVRVQPAAGPSSLRVVSGSRESAERFLARLAIEEGQNAWRVRDGRKTHDAAVEVELLVARDLALDAVIHEGSIRCMAPLVSLKAMVSLGGVHYDVQEPAPPEVSLRVSNGTVTARLPRVTGSFTASSGVGHVDVTLFEAGSRGSAALSTGRGDLTLRLADPEALRVVSLVCPMGSVSMPPPSPTGAPGLDVDFRVGLGDLRVVPLAGSE